MGDTAFLPAGRSPCLVTAVWCGETRRNTELSIEVILLGSPVLIMRPIAAAGAAWRGATAAIDTDRLIDVGLEKDAIALPS